MFGSDDILVDGALAPVVALLEREQPSFATVNKQVYNHDLTQQIWSAANAVADRRFDRFEDLMAAVGLGQLAFMTGNIELTTAARAFDPDPFLKADSRHAYLAAYLQKHHGKPAYYASRPHVIHRIADPGRRDDRVGAAFDIAVTLPILLDAVLRETGAPDDFFERMTGDKRIAAYDDPDGPTFVDLMLENLLLAIAEGRYFSFSQRWALEAILRRCASHRPRQLDEIWQMQRTVQALDHQAESAQARIEQGRRTCADAARNFTRQAGAPS